ncbi:MAG: NosD domain-containing protein [Thermoplasmatota archaeon]
MKKTSITLVFLFLLLFCALNSMFNLTPITALDTNQTNRIMDQNEQTYTSIQQAINTVSNGSIIYLSNGTYTEQITINKSISLIGENSNNSILTSNESIVVIITAENVHINNLSIQGNTDQHQQGINILYSQNILISNNTFSSFTNQSIIIENKSHHIIIENNTFTRNKNAISIYGKQNQVSYNEFINNTNTGIIIYSNANDNQIDHNTFLNNPEYGLHIQSNAKNTTIYLNNFMDIFDAKNKAEQTIWYNITLKMGNYWERYHGKDVNNDGIGDSPYTVSEDNHINDPYPLMYPVQTHTKNNYDPSNPGLFYVLTLGVIVSIILLIPIAYWWRKNVLFKK